MNNSDSDFGNKSITIYYNQPVSVLYREELNNKTSYLTFASDCNHYIRDNYPELFHK